MKRKKTDSLILLPRAKDHKKSTTLPSKSKLAFNVVIWYLSFDFLSLNKILTLSQISKRFIDLSISWVIIRYQFEFGGYKEFYLKNYSHISNHIKWKFFNERVQQYRLYYNLIDRSYLPLFYALTQYDQYSAIQFLQGKINRVNSGLSNENIVDMVFFQKNAKGQTTIIIANDLGLQHYLNFCFNELILKGHLLNKGKHCLIQTEELKDILDYLDDRMGMSALWVDACSRLCNQKDVYEAIAKKPAFNKHWNNFGLMENDCSLATLSTISALLGSTSLLKYALTGIPLKKVRDQMQFPTYYTKGYLYYNNSEMRATPTALACLTQNHELITLANNFYKDVDSKFHETMDAEAEMDFRKLHSIAFKIIEKNIFNEIFVSWESKLLLAPIGLFPKYLGVNSLEHKKPYNLMDLLIATDWKEGTSLIFTKIVKLINQGKDTDNLILSHVFTEAKVKVIDQLIKHGLSLTTQFNFTPMLETNHYPLVVSVILDLKETMYCITNKIGPECALAQIEAEIQSIRTLYEPLALQYLIAFKTVLTEKIEASKNGPSNSHCGC